MKNVIFDTAYVFDWDDTLIKDKAKSHLYRNGVYICSFTADEYHHYEVQPDDSFDFSEFDNPIKIIAEFGPLWEKLKEINGQRYIPFFILTARNKSAQRHIYNFLLEHNIDGILISNIFCIGGPGVFSTDVPMKKEEAMLTYIKPHFKVVHFYDDNDLTINRFKKLTNQGIYSYLVK